MSRWFRHYAGMMRDDKLVSVAIRAKQPVERVVWVWGAILESAAEIDDDGRYCVDAAEIAYFLRADEDDIHSILTGLENADRISADCVVKWGDRQFVSDKSARRQASYRERIKAKTVGNQHPNGECDVTATSPQRDSDAPETETETETENKDSCASEDALKPDHIVQSWNDLAKRLGRPTIRDLTPERRQLLKARIAGYSIEDFRTVLGNIEQSPFLRGEKGWQGVTFDWFTKKANFQKILEGNYNG